MSQELLRSAMLDAEGKAWEALSGYKFWMFGYHAARWVNYNQLLSREQRFRNPFGALVHIARHRIEQEQTRLPLSDASDGQIALIGSEGDGA